MVAEKLLCFVAVVLGNISSERNIWSRSHIVFCLFVLDQEVGFADEENTDEL